ncbi:MAG: PEP-CTERM sorting domain-containing protein [Thermoguttaceae bacterium]
MYISPTHIYRLFYTGEGTTLSFQVFDGDPGPRYWDNYPGSLEVKIIPEPSFLLLLGTGTFSLLAYIWQRRRHSHIPARQRLL